MNWQKILARGFTSVNELLSFLELPLDKGSVFAEKQFATRVPLGFAQRMHKGNPRDPLLLQILAAAAELDVVEGYAFDPLQELRVNPVKGLLHKYHGRVLLPLTGVCAVNCRFCFRRHFPYQDNNPGRSGWKKVIDYIHQDSSIAEVILSGGDPLLATNEVISDLIQQLETIPHVHTVRIHTRVPIVLPERIDAGFKTLLAATQLHKVIVLHCNHAQELNEEVKEVCKELKQIGCFLLNQSVLLSGINDDARVLASLNQLLFAYGVLPYYLHVLDKIQGAAHFDIPWAQTQKIYKTLQQVLPGYLVPKLVREDPDTLHKTQLLV